MKNKILKTIKVFNEMAEPTDEEIESQEDFISLEKWDTIKCRNCGKITSILNCHSCNGDIVCPRCGHLN